MRTFLARRWFVLLLAAGVLLALVRTEWIRPAVAPIPQRLVVGVNLFLMAWGLESRKLYRALSRPRPAFATLAVSYGLLPVSAWLIGAWFLPPDLEVGLLIIAAVPCTVASAAIWTRLAGGNEALALFLTLLTMCCSWLVTPWWLTTATGELIELNPRDMMRDLLLYLLLPVTAGQLARTAGPLRRLAARGKLTMDVVSRVLIFLVILQAVVLAADHLGPRGLGDDRLTQLLTLFSAAIACLATHLIAWSAGYWGGRLLGLDRPDRIAVAFSSSQKTLPVSLLLWNTFYLSRFPLAVLPLLFYHVGQLLLDTVIADLLRGAAGKASPGCGPCSGASVEA